MTAFVWTVNTCNIALDNIYKKDKFVTDNRVNDNDSVYSNHIDR